MMDKIEIFRNELSMIQNELMRDFIGYCVDHLPDYFFEIPASSSGKFHPPYALGHGGLMRHTKAAVKIAYDLVRLEQNQHLDSDLIIAALILHDGIKRGPEEQDYTITKHPIYAAEFIGQMAYEYRVERNLEVGCFGDKIETLQRLIRSHMGQWNIDYRLGKVVLPKPQEEDEKFVHMCDYIASRSYLICEVE